MIAADVCVDIALKHGYRLWTGVPCSYLHPLINHVISRSDIRYVSAANEGDAIAIAAGAELGGMRSIAMFQNSGLGNAISPLTSLSHVFRLPTLLIVTLRGEPAGPADEPQHELMGRITETLLEAIEIPWESFPSNAGELDAAFERAEAWFTKASRPYALVLRKGAIAPIPAPTRDIAARTCVASGSPVREGCCQRHEFLDVVRRHTTSEDILVATTGYTGRELYALGDRSNHFYMVGSMGCASSFGLGLAIANPTRRIIVLDGDGAALMRLGALATIGWQVPKNMVHIIFANGIHESTGGQSIAHPCVDYAALATLLGYPKAVHAATPDAMLDALALPDGPCLIHVPVVPGVLPDLPRPRSSPIEVAGRLRTLLARREHQ